MPVNQNTKPQPVLLAFSVLAGLTTLASGLAALGYDQKVIGLIGLVIAVITQSLGFYVRGLVVPFSDTAAYVNDFGAVIAGPASTIQNGTYVTVSTDSDEPTP